VELAYVTGLTTWAVGPESERPPKQLDAEMGAVNAIQEMLIHTVRGVLQVFPAVPRAWKNISFKNMRAEGAFLVSATMKDGKIEGIEIFSERGGRIKLRNNIAEEVIILQRGQEETRTRSELLLIDTVQGKQTIVKPADELTIPGKQKVTGSHPQAERP